MLPNRPGGTPPDIEKSLINTLSQIKLDITNCIRGTPDINQQGVISRFNQDL
jgi:hypothetical protein